MRVKQSLGSGKCGSRTQRHSKKIASELLPNKQKIGGGLTANASNSTNNDGEGRGNFPTPKVVRDALSIKEVNIWERKPEGPLMSFAGVEGRQRRA